MKVRELIEKLQEFDPELPVIVMEEILYEGASVELAIGAKLRSYYPTYKVESQTLAVFIYAEGDEHE